jgi:pyruvate carboxylase
MRSRRHGLRPVLTLVCDDEDLRETRLPSVGPDAQHLDLFGDKSGTRSAATAAGVPVIRGINCPVDLERHKPFPELPTGGAMVLKAVAGDGARGTRVVTTTEKVESAYERCRSEKLHACRGHGELSAGP